MMIEILKTFVYAAGVLLIYALSLVIYRLYLHPLARFPGPKLAAATKWYEFYFDILKAPGGQFAWELERMHDVYGPIVRINPQELHVKDPSWVGVLYANPAAGARDRYPPAATMSGSPVGVFATIDHELHRKRRSALSPFFSKSAVFSTQALLYKNIDLLTQKLKRTLKDGGIVNIRREYLAYTTDTICDYVFSETQGLLHDDKKAGEWLKTLDSIILAIPIVKQFPWLNPLIMRLPLRPLQVLVPDAARLLKLDRDLHHQADTFLRTRPDMTSEKDSSSAEDVIKHKTLFESIMTSKVLPPHEKSTERLAQEGVVVLTAASETTARVLSIATFHMLANKERVLDRLQKELGEVMSEPDSQVDLKILEQLPWLSAVIRESLRIVALVTSRSPLISPKEALRYGDWVIPPGTPVGMSQRDTLYDPTIFPLPGTFLPERWLTNPDSKHLDRMNQVFAPFSRGSRICLGLNLAMAELYIVIASVVRRFDLELYDTIRERDIDAKRDFFLGEPSAEAKGVRVKGVVRA